MKSKFIFTLCLVSCIIILFTGCDSISNDTAIVKNDTTTECYNLLKETEQYFITSDTENMINKSYKIRDIYNNTKDKQDKKYAQCSWVVSCMYSDLSFQKIKSSMNADNKGRIEQIYMDISEGINILSNNDDKEISAYLKQHKDYLKKIEATYNKK